MAENTQELSAEQITFSIPAEIIHQLRLNGTKDPIIGQARAISALELGLGIKADGYNIFIMGASGTGRRTVLTTLLADYKANPVDLQDIAYVYNFSHPLEPKALSFPAGVGTKFRTTMQSAIESIRKQALQISKSEAFTTASKKIIAAADAEENQLLADFEAKMTKAGFKLLQVKDDDERSMDLVPIVKGKTISFDELQDRATNGKFPTEQLSAMRENYYRSLDQMAELFNVLREKRRMTEKQIRTLKAKSAEPIIDRELDSLKKIPGCEATSEITAHLAALREDLLSRLHTYSEPFKSPTHKRNFFGRYAINLICEHSSEKNYVVQEEVPTFANLFGSIEAVTGNEDATLNGHLRLRAGAVHRAFGGFLVLRLQDLLMEEGAWPYLKRVLQSGKIEIQTPPTGNHLPSLLKPQPLPAKMKVIILGGEHSYDFLYQEDPDFQKLFKVCAEFDSVMPRTEKTMAKYVSFIDEFARKQGFLPVDDSGMARIISHAARLSDYRDMLTTRFTLITDLITEADYQGRKEGVSNISAEIVSRTIENRRYLHKLPEEKYSEMIESREILLDVTGTAIGKVNGLAVQDRGYHAFGIPVAVTAQASPGNKGVINIERESGLSGEIYDKAHLIIQGLLRQKYARDIPLALSASICFEQSYTEVDGDSASCAEFFALLSAIAQIPLRQDIAVTGSLNQLGDVQPVGGIPEKIEGFFEACNILGLTGTQGVILPRRNMSNVILSDRVQQAVTDGLFHIWAITAVDEGLSILSGIPTLDFERKVADTLKGYSVQMQNYFK
jgi:lon-related putative ATP-dependent protease